MHLPHVLTPGSEEQALGLLRRYFGGGDDTRFTGARFDTWDSTGTRTADADRFTADDLVAVSLLNAHVPRDAAIALLDTRADEFSALLAALPDRDLATERHEWADDWAGFRLWDAVRALPGMGHAVTSKLLARKRPLLHPITDSVVEDATGAVHLWPELRVLLQDEPELAPRLLDLRHRAGLSAEVSPLRVLVVVTWMAAKGY